MPARPRLRTIPPPRPMILAATDLGSVEVAKHGNLYLLTDPRGDIRVDGRGLGLYELDTRVLSASMLRLNGAPLTLLRGPYLREQRRFVGLGEYGAGKADVQAASSGAERETL